MKVYDIYRCNHCKLQVMVSAVAGEKTPVPQCCGEPMMLQKPNTVDAAKEKHVPVIEAAENGTIVKVGSVTHPSTAEHFIEWIELIAADHVCRVQLTAGEAPEAFFAVPYSPELKARISCNLHGVWMDR